MRGSCDVGGRWRFLMRDGKNNWILGFSGIHGLIPCIASGVWGKQHRMEHIDGDGSSALYL